MKLEKILAKINNLKAMLKVLKDLTTPKEFLNTKPKNTFIFDFDNTIINDAVLLKVVKISSAYDKIKIDKISELIKKRKINGRPIIHEILPEINEILGHNINKKDFQKALKNLTITDNINNIIREIRSQGYEIFIIGGAYSTCDILLKISEQLNIKPENIFSGLDSFDKNNNLFFDINKNGFSNCKNGTRITNDWNKVDVIKYLKKTNQTKGKIIHIGDGENDLEVWKSGEVDQFIGFGVNHVSKKVKKEAPVFVENIEDFEKEINKFIN